MAWSERQRAMLDEMGIRLWPEPAAPAREVVAKASTGAAGTAWAEPFAPTARHAAAAPAELQPKRTAEPVGSTTATAAPAPAAGVVAEAPLHSDVAQMDWAALRDAVANCRACKLCERRTQTVFGVGNERAHWMIVGEAPGEQEDLRGEPFVGKAGQLLDNMLAAIGLTRGEATAERQVYIVNTLKCRPPGNRNPEPDELAQCERFLVRQLALVQPRIVLAMGRFAVQSLLRSSEPVGRLRGQVHRYQGVPLIVTYHPAYLLRNPADKARAWDDLCLAREVAQRESADAASA